MSEIAGTGVIVHNPDLFKQYVRKSVDQWNGVRKLERRYDQFGWKDEESSAFSLELSFTQLTRWLLSSVQMKCSRDLNTLAPAEMNSIGASV